MRRSFDSYRRAKLQVCDNGEFLFSQAPTGDTAFLFAVFPGRVLWFLPYFSSLRSPLIVEAFRSYKFMLASKMRWGVARLITQQI